MIRRFVVAVALMALCVVADSEHEEHGRYADHHHDHPDGSDSYSFDHEVFLGSRALASEFSQLGADEAKDRLLVIAQAMDTDKDGSLSKDELVAALSKNFLALNQEESLDKLHDLDDNKDSFVDWPEYIKNTYNVDVEQLDALVANTSAHSDPHVKATLRTYQNDQLRFKLADVDGDGKLSLVEFTAFSHPYDFEHMLPAEVKQTVESFDQDADGKISLAEFLREDASGGHDAEWKKQEEERFKKELDKNGDGFLDNDEVRQWIAPSLQSSSNDEAQHLMTLVDGDADGKMSQAEITNALHILAGSAPEHHDDDDDDDDDVDHDEL